MERRRNPIRQSPNILDATERRFAHGSGTSSRKHISRTSVRRFRPGEKVFYLSDEMCQIIKETMKELSERPPAKLSPARRGSNPKSRKFGKKLSSLKSILERILESLAPCPPSMPAPFGRGVSLQVLSGRSRGSLRTRSAPSAGGSTSVSPQNSSNSIFRGPGPTAARCRSAAQIRPGGDAFAPAREGAALFARI